MPPSFFTLLIQIQMFLENPLKFTVTKFEMYNTVTNSGRFRLNTRVQYSTKEFRRD